jgi:2,4-dienoyl-CoA reductase-like NADH-dependent reductase (Old Yellow Enzyme family)
VHGRRGYIVAQFLSPASNLRTDAYRGDTLDGRIRLLVEIVAEIRARCGDTYPLGVRLSGDEETADGLTPDDTRQIADALQSLRRWTISRSPQGCGARTSRTRATRGIRARIRRGGEAGR